MNENPGMLAKWWNGLPPVARTTLAHAFSAASGLLSALAVYYVLYRIALPSKPFIYVAF